MSKSELKHHGTKGQQWGVRHGPPYPVQSGSGTYIKAGTKFHRITRYDEKAAVGHAYVTYLKEDNQRYSGFFAARQKALGKGGAVYSVTMTASRDLKSPSKKEREEIFKELYSRDQKTMGRHLGKYHKTEEYDALALMPKSFYEKKYSELKGDQVVKKGYTVFVKAIGGDEYVRKQYFDELIKRGYDFIQDDQDSNIFGRSPSILLEREKSTDYKGQREMSTKEITKNLYENRNLENLKKNKRLNIG